MTSAFYRLRASYEPRLPRVLSDLASIKLAARERLTGQPDLAQLFPKTYGQPLLHLQASTPSDFLRKQLKLGVVLSGGPAPGGHNVLWGLHAGLAQVCSQPQVIGFGGGPQGILKEDLRPLTGERPSPTSETAVVLMRSVPDATKSNRVKISRIAIRFYTNMLSMPWWS